MQETGWVQVIFSAGERGGFLISTLQILTLSLGGLSYEGLHCFVWGVHLGAVV